MEKRRVMRYVVETDYNGRVKGWKPIKKKPKMYTISLPPNVCSKCGKLYMDTWSKFCCLDGKWLISVSRLDFGRRKILGFKKPSEQPEWLLCGE